jgi:hypothetical protein
MAAYDGRCALSGLRKPLLVDAAHIIAGKDERRGQLYDPPSHSGPRLWQSNVLPFEKPNDISENRCADPLLFCPIH